MRLVGEESRKTYEDKLKNGFFEKYMSGEGLDIGFSGYLDNVVPILENAIGVDTNYPGYDGKTLPFEVCSQDYVYSSHCLEHIQDYKKAIQEWFRVTNVGGHVIIVVPHQYLYEKRKNLPSRWNGDHKRFYTPSSLLKEVEESLPTNTYRVRFLEDGDKDFDYSIDPTQHSKGQYEITLVIQKIIPASWELDNV
jgi:SAM-dependent methyltransferase